MESLEETLSAQQDKLSDILPFALRGKNILQLDLSVDNPELYEFDILDVEQLEVYIRNKLVDNDSLIAIGGYGEDRLFYQRSPHFGEGEHARTIHLGIDVWCEPITPVYTPLNARVHSFKDNDQLGDYGPTIILSHKVGKFDLYTLYGHLARRSLEEIEVGMEIGSGEKFAEIGDVHENGQWPPHLHFQLIRDMKDNKGDFPGVASKPEKAAYLELCPDPYLLIKN